MKKRTVRRTRMVKAKEESNGELAAKGGVDGDPTDLLASSISCSKVRQVMAAGGEIEEGWWLNCKVWRWRWE